jgi:hypothetical protein
MLQRKALSRLLLLFCLAMSFMLMPFRCNSAQLRRLKLSTGSFNTPALPPRASAAQCRWYCEFYLDGGGTAANATFNVTHTDSTTSAIVVSIVASVRSARKIELVPAAGKIISSVQQVTLSASTGTASNFGVVAEQFSGVKAGVLAANGTIEYEGLVRRVGSADACLSANLNCTGISTGAVEGSIQLMQG